MYHRTDRRCGQPQGTVRRESYQVRDLLEKQIPPERPPAEETGPLPRAPRPSIQFHQCCFREPHGLHRSKPGLTASLHRCQQAASPHRAPGSPPFFSTLRIRHRGPLPPSCLPSPFCFTLKYNLDKNPRLISDL